MRVRPGIDQQGPGRHIGQVARNIKPVLAAINRLEYVAGYSALSRYVEGIPHDVSSERIGGIDHHVAKVVVDCDAVDHDIAPAPGLAVIEGDKDVPGRIGIDDVRVVAGNRQ